MSIRGDSFIEDDAGYPSIEGYDSDTSNEEQFENNFFALMNKLFKKPYSVSYEDFVHFAQTILKSEDINKIRKVFKLFSTVHAIDGATWCAYLQVEMRVSQSDSEIENVSKLFRVAIKDFYSERIYLMYAHFAKRCRDPYAIWNEILGSICYHPKYTNAIFELYRHFVKSTNLMETSKNHLIIESLKDQLKIPHDNLFERYSEFCSMYKNDKYRSKVDWDGVEALYKRANDDYNNIIIDYENSIYYSGDSFEAYAKYIKECQGKINLHMLYVVCERLVAKHCADYRAWEIYLNFIELRLNQGSENLKDLPLFKQSYLDICDRALRCCPNAYTLYVKRIYYIEKHETIDGENFKDTLEKALCFSINIRQYSSLWMEYLTAVKRKTDFKNTKDVEILRSNFQLAVQSLEMHFKGEPTVQDILLVWAKIEYEILNNPTAGKNLFLNAMENVSVFKQPSLWLEFIALESQFDITSARGLYKKAFTLLNYHSCQPILYSWQVFERCYGTRKTIASCNSYILHQLKLKMSKYEKIPDVHNGGKKRSLPENTEQSPNKRVQKNATVPKTKSNVKVFAEDKNNDRLRVFVKNLNYEISEIELFDFFDNLNVETVEIARNADGRCRGYAEVQFNTEYEAQKALTKDGVLFKGRPLQIRQIRRERDQSQVFKYAAEQNSTVFIKNLVDGTTKEDINKIFEMYGVVKDIRLVYFKNGKFKNIAFLEYESELEAETAVGLTNGKNFKGQEISVAMAKTPSLGSRGGKKMQPSVLPNANTEGKKISAPGKRDINARDSIKQHQKPRLSFIPNSVLTKLESSKRHQDAKKNAIAKTNEDFREMLLKYSDQD